MREIVINSWVHGKIITVVSDRDYKRVSKFKWNVRFQKRTNSYYVMRTQTKPVRKLILLARYIMNATDSSICVDHIDHNTLNNCIENLRLATSVQNGSNKKCNAKGTSMFKGVYKSVCIQGNKTYTYFRARIRENYKLRSLGVFKTEIEAAKAYNEAAIKYHGDFACLNEINETGKN